MRVPLLLTFAIGLLACNSKGLAARTQESAAGPVPSAHSVRYIEREMFVPVLNAMPRGLDVVEIYADLPGKHPLAVLTHGTSIKPEERMKVTPWAQYNQGLWFARRGYVVLIVTRKGYGRSGGVQDAQSGGCNTRGSFLEAGEASIEDLTQVMRWAGSRPEIDSETIISAGVSTGGFAQVALSANPPKRFEGSHQLRWRQRLGRQGTQLQS